MKQHLTAFRLIVLAHCVAQMVGDASAGEKHSGAGVARIDLSETGSLIAARSNESSPSDDLWNQYMSRTCRLHQQVSDLMHPTGRFSVTPSLGRVRPGGALQPMIRITFRF
jgi:hypothetical protein